MSCVPSRSSALEREPARDGRQRWWRGPSSPSTHWIPSARAYFWTLALRLAAQVAFILREISARCAAVNLRLRRPPPPAAGALVPESAARAILSAASCDSISAIFLSSAVVMSAMHREGITPVSLESLGVH